MYSITIIAKEWIMPNAKAICVKIKSNPTPPPPFQEVNKLLL